MTRLMLALHVKVVPGTSRDRVAGRYGDAIKLQVSAPPEKRKANAAVVRVLAGFFEIKPAQIELISGAGKPRKQFRISGLGPGAFTMKMAGLS